MSEPMTICKAIPHDADAITALVAEAYSPYIPRIGKEPGPMLDDYRQVIAEASVFVQVLEGVIVGVLVLRPEGSVVLLENIAVLPRCKGQGIGKALMSFSEAYAREAGCDAIELYTHQLMSENIAIYQKLGYQETHRATEHGYARVFMRKTIHTSWSGEPC